MRKVTILGAGAYSIALSRILSKNGAKVTLYTKFAEEKELLDRERGNDKVLPNVKLMNNTSVSDNLEESVKDCELIIIAVPSNVVRSTMQDLKLFYASQILCIASKGVEQGTGYFMDQVIREEVSDAKLCALSGPSYAAEVSNFLPTVVTVAGASEATNLLSEYFSNNRFKVEQTTDVRGVLVCGALKNILAIGAGILSALDAGDDALTALITGGVREVGVFQSVLGGEHETVYLSCGIGDTVVTCAGGLSRNKELGKLIGQGKTVEEAIKVQGKTVEGYTALLGVKKIAIEKNLNLPILQTICNIVLDGEKTDLLSDAICK
ncbi:MAG: NAD(P)H-dependent glycerol-3-phosphate dehydrogenase [Candidatus Nomurabacteria bacterium]|jgi:glycerol-3-phosphate dehydrogenase (NAD(P)+)|nr:NAD(P)H-dependent glycerol-3-phosphate dehydrogenase [Candidatus Nomurabacteria bacterium]